MSWCQDITILWSYGWMDVSATQGVVVTSISSPYVLLNALGGSEPKDCYATQGA